jgi:CheY-like chemotaxis protein
MLFHLFSLFSNAIKFSDDNTEVFLQVTYDTNRRSYVLAVHDQGIGIAKDDLERLFHAFEQLENAYTKSKQGTGLGLMISKKIVEELHKGDIWVSSEVGEGSTFYFSIPIKEDQSEILKINNAPKDAGHVLVVEDSPSYQNILINCLQDMKHLTVTNTIEAAKEVLMNESFDYIILDFFLHDGISSELLLYLEEKQLDLPVVMISAEDDNEIVAHLEEHKIAIHAILNKSDITHICDFLSRGQHER